MTTTTTTLPANNNNNSNNVIKCFVPATISSDVKLRNKVLAVFNKRRRDFPTDAKYNDYLEFVEEMCFNLIEGIEVSETEKMLAREKREHAKEIKERRERNLAEDRVSCPEKFMVFSSGVGDVGGVGGAALRGGDDHQNIEDEEMLQMMMDYQPEGATRGAGEAMEQVVAYTEYDETTEEGKKAKREASLKACGFDPLKTEYERSVLEAFQTIRV